MNEINAIVCPECEKSLEDYDFTPLDTVWGFDFICPYCGKKLHAHHEVDMWNSTEYIDITSRE